MSRPTERALACNADWGRDRFEFHSRDGLHSPEEFRTGDLLLLDALTEAPPDRLLVQQANDGVVGTVAGAVATAVTMTETSARAARVCEENAARNGVEAAVELTADASTLTGPFDTAAYVPRPYTPLSVGKQHMANALAALEPGGRLLLAARPETGLHRYRDCLADIAGAVETRRSRDDWAVLSARRPETVDAPTFVERRHTETTVGGVALHLVTEPGLFSHGELDHGTRLLLETAPVAADERVLDLCCGCGPVGAYAAATADCEVHLTDDDCRASACAAATLSRTGVEGTVVTADCTDGVGGQFDRILTNPPTHAGSGVLSDLFAGAADALSPGGSCWLVHHRRLDLSSHLREFEQVETVATGEEHAVVRAGR